MKKEDREKAFISLRDNKEVCLAIADWVEEECEKLEDSRRWNKEDFEVEGKSNLKTSSKLRLLVSKLIKKEIPEVNRTSYE